MIRGERIKLYSRRTLPGIVMCVLCSVQSLKSLKTKPNRLNQQFPLKRWQQKPNRKKNHGSTTSETANLYAITIVVELYLHDKYLCGDGTKNNKLNQNMFFFCRDASKPKKRRKPEFCLKKEEKRYVFVAVLHFNSSLACPSFPLLPQTQLRRGIELFHLSFNI